MIQTHTEYLQANEALRELEEALAALRARLGEPRSDLFAAMAQDYLESIASIRLDIDTYTGISAVRSASAPLWLGLEAPELSLANIRTSLLAGWLERLRKSVVAIAEFKLLGSSARGHPQSVLEACDFRLVGFQPGSLKIGLDLPKPDQMSLFRETIRDPQAAGRESLVGLLESAAEAADLVRQGRLILTRHEPLNVEQRVLLKQVLRLTPGRRERVRAIVLEGALVPRRSPVRLDASLRPILASMLGEEEEPARVEEFEGTLREIDLDERHFIIRNRPDNQSEVTLFFEPNLVEDARRALDRKVRVEGSREVGPRQRLRALVIEILEDAPL